MKFLKLVSLYSLTGILLGVGFIFPAYWFLGIVGIALHLKILANTESGQLWGSALAWFIKFLFVWGFFWTIYPIKWLPFDFGQGELLLIALYWVKVSLFLATGGLIFALFYKMIKGALVGTSWLGYVLVPFLWVVAEVAGSFLFALFSYGPGSMLNAYFSLGYVGLLLGEHSFMLPLAKFGGVYALSFVAVAFALWLSRVKPQRNNKLQLALPTGLVLLLLLTSSVSIHPGFNADKTASVAIVNTSFPVEELFDKDSLPDRLVQQEAALDAAVATEAKYIILPEDARFFDQTDEASQAKNYFKFKHPETEVLIVDSSRRPGATGAVLQGMVYDSVTNQHEFFHKKYLVPQGEFVPYISEFIFDSIGFSYIIDELKGALSYTIGPKTSQVDLPDDAPGVLFCFESSSGTGIRDLLKDRPDLPFIAHPVSHAWFNEPESLWSQLETSLQVQAVWNDVAIVSATNHGPSQLFLPNGAVEEPEFIASGEHWEVGLYEVPIRQ